MEPFELAYKDALNTYRSFCCGIELSTTLIDSDLIRSDAFRDMSAEAYHVFLILMSHRGSHYGRLGGIPFGPKLAGENGVSEQEYFGGLSELIDRGIINWDAPDDGSITGSA